MPANPLTIVTNFPAAARITGVARHEMKEDSGGPNGEAKVIIDDFDGNNIVAIIGRGETDQNITYIALYNTNGVLSYCYPNAAGTGIIVTPTKP